MNVHNIQASCFITWWINSICKFNKAFHSGKWTTLWPWTSVGCHCFSPWNTEAPTLSGFGSPHLRQVAFRANLAGFGDGRINLEVSCFSTRYPYEIIRPKKSLGSTSMWPRWDTGKSNPKNFLFHWSVNVSGKYSWRIPGPPRRFLVTFFSPCLRGFDWWSPHAGPYAENRWRLEKSIEWNHELNRILPQKMSRDGHKPESDCINWHWDSCNSSLRPFPANGWGLWSCQHITEHQLLETTTVN